MRKLAWSILLFCLSIYIAGCNQTMDMNILSETPSISTTPKQTDVPSNSPSPTPATKRDIEGTSRVWMSLNHPGELLDTTKWKYVYDNVDALQIRIYDLNETDADDLSDFAALLNRSGIRLSIECEGLDYTICENYKEDPESIGRLSAMQEVAQLERLRKAGYEPDYVMFDHPVTRAIFPYEDYEQLPQVSYAEAADALEYCMKCWRETYPDIQFFYCPNFPNHGWKG